MVGGAAPVLGANPCDRGEKGEVSGGDVNDVSVVSEVSLWLW